MVQISTFLILELILADQLADLSPHGRVISVVEFYISTIRANIGRSTGRSNPHGRVISWSILHFYY